MNLTRRAFSAIGLALAVALVAPATSADAAPTANVEVMVLYASNETPPGIDPKIDEGYPPGTGPSAQLSKPPFSAYKTYRLKDKKLLALVKPTPGELGLPNGRTLKVTLNDVVTDKNEKRFKLSASISQPTGAAYLPLLEVTAAPNTTFFVAGQSYDKGSLVLAFTVK